MLFLCKIVAGNSHERTITIQCDKLSKIMSTPNKKNSVRIALPPKANPSTIKLSTLPPSAGTMVMTPTTSTTSTVAPVALRHPIIEFEYPSSEDGKMKLRYLRVTSADADYIKGYELESPLSNKEGLPKTFSRNRLTRQSPTLLSF